ncbi:MAG: hypothetical protein V1495_11570 [Pseudomonadota bacterium]
MYQGMLNGDTGEIALRMTGYWTADAGSFYIMRSDIKGNKNTHEFTILLTKDNTLDNYSHLEFVGTGVSQGTGNYFLFKAWNGTHKQAVDGTLPAVGYYCFDAGAMTATDVTTTVATSNCAAYQATVDALSPLGIANIPQADFDMAIQ